MHNNSFFKPLLFLASILLFVSCDKEYSAVGDTLIGENHFELAKYTSGVVAYNEKITSIESKNLPVNALGIYDNPAFGKTNANFVTQLTLANLAPTFGANPVIESVTLEVPYFSTLLTTDATTGDHTYELDSIYGEPKAKIKLSVYESGLYMGNQNGTAQTFYTNQNAEFDNYKIGNRLNDDSDVAQNDAFFFDPAEHKTVTKDDANKETTTRTVPSMLLKLNKAYFDSKIIHATASNLAANDVFINYFKGLYFKVEQSGSDKGSLAMMNFAKGTITIKYKEDSSTTPVTRLDKTLVINMSGNTASLLEQSNTNTDYATAVNNPNKILGDEKLYLKGGEGSLAVIDLFGSADNYKYEVLKNANGKPIDKNGNVIPLESDGNPKAGYFLTYTKNNTSNGISDELDDIRFPLIDDSQGQIYHSIKNRWLINEANLVFNIDTDTKAMGKIDPVTGKAFIPEPDRIYLYDYTNNTTFLDYYLGASLTNKNASKALFGGYITKDATSKRGVSYKVRITNHINSLVKNVDAKNIKLGLVVTEDINTADMFKLKTTSADISEAPKASVMNPLGTVLYGGRSTSNPTDAKLLKLEIFYTKPK
jgi:hypothetical protein